MKSKAMLTVNEAAAALGKRPETVRRWIAAGFIKARHEGAHVFIPADALEPLARRVCACCGKPYHPDRPTRAGCYCSKACAWRTAYERRKAEHQATRAPGRPPPPKLSAVNPHLRAAVAMIRGKATL